MNSIHMNYEKRSGLLIGLFILTLVLSSAACSPQSDTATTNTVATKNNSPAAATSPAGQAAGNTNETNHGSTDHSGMDHSGMDHSGMDHGSMDHSAMQSSPNAASAAYDLQFLDTMIMHHQGAIDMSQMAEKQAEQAELKAFARKIAADQQKEIEQMRRWRGQWYGEQPAAINMELAGMKESMMDMKGLSNAQGANFDLEFVQLMQPHHQGAVVMGKEALAKAEHPELKSFAGRIIAAQELEIKQMQVWAKEWAGNAK